MKSPFQHAVQNAPPGWAALAASLLLLTSSARCCAQDQFVFYFGGTTAGVGDIGATTFDSNGDFWVVGRSSSAGATPTPRISKVELSGENWTADPHVLDEDLAFFYRSADLPAGTTNPDWGGPIFGTPASFLLNPAPLTIDIPTSSGGTTQVTYQAGELAFLTDAMGVIAEPDGTGRHDATKKIVRYDLRKVDNPAGVSGPTSSLPDFDTASSGPESLGGIVFGQFGLADWNDVFTQVASEQDLRDAAGGVAGSDNFGRRFGWSSDGQSIYAVDAGSNTGGIYKIDATTTGGVTRIWSDTRSDETGDRIVSEPGVIPTSVRDFDPANPGVGDQIITEGSADGGNNGGVNVFLDTGAGALASPTPLFTEADFRDFAEYVGVSAPQYLSFASDGAGNLYFHESRTDGVYVYDTAGRLAKIASEAEHNEFQVAQGVGRNDIMLDLQVRTNNSPGFAVNEIIYTDDTLEAPAGVLAYKVGDFDRDNDVDSSDLVLFSSAIGARGETAEVEEYKFDLNGNPETVFDPVDQRFEHVSNAAAVVDWKDVKILQQFVDLPNGDANLDGSLDFADLDIMAANYFTLGGPADKRWTTGDFASSDPLYALDAPDANLVNQVDLAVLAGEWVNVLGQPPVTAADADAQGYAGVFRDDLLAAFSIDPSGLAGDYNGDGAVDTADYSVWRDTLGEAGAGRDADGDRDGTVDIDDYQIWRDNFGRTIADTQGDFNGDGTVDAADFSLWRDQVGQTGTGLAADGNGDRVVSIADYEIWRSGFGANLATTAALAPEPSTGLGLLLVIFGGSCRRIEV